MTEKDVEKYFGDNPTLIITDDPKGPMQTIIRGNSFDLLKLYGILGLKLTTCKMLSKEMIKCFVNETFDNEELEKLIKED